MIGILAFGSLRTNPGRELSAATLDRCPAITPFPVEYARYSSTRGGAPTLVPHAAGSTVKAEIMVLRENVTLQDARDMLWRRERHRVCSGERYEPSANPGPNQVIVRELGDFAGLETVLYTDFTDEGKIANPDPIELAEKAIQSVKKAKPCYDGITYLIDAKAAEIVTPLTPKYEAEILRLTGASDLTEARERVRARN